MSPVAFLEITETVHEGVWHRIGAHRDHVTYCGTARAGAEYRHYPSTYDAILEHDGLTDVSVTLGYKYLDFMFSDARFILTVRDIDQWLASMEALFNELGTVAIAERHHRLNRALYGTDVFDADRMREAYLRHLEDVTNYFRDRSSLLTIDVTSGNPYPALAEFLGLEKPDAPFPHLNDRATMRRLTSVRSRGFTD